MINPIPQSMEFVRAGKVRALAVTTKKSPGRAARPSHRRRVRAGLRGTRLVRNRRAESRPAGIVDKLNAALGAALAKPAAKARLADLGVEPMPMTAAQFGKFIATENDKWGKVIRDANIKLD